MASFPFPTSPALLQSIFPSNTQLTHVSVVDIITHIWLTIPFVWAAESGHNYKVHNAPALPRTSHLAHRTFIAHHKSKSYRIGRTV